MPFPLFGNGLLPSFEAWSGPTAPDPTPPPPDVPIATPASSELVSATSAETGRSLEGELTENDLTGIVYPSNDLRTYRKSICASTITRESMYKVQYGSTNQDPPSSRSLNAASAQSREQDANIMLIHFNDDPKWMSPLSLTVPKIIDVKDEKYFHNYLTQAYPKIPYGAGSIWTSVLPSYALEYDYLMFAMLALGASELDYRISGSFSRHGAEYRAKAISSLKDATNSHILDQKMTDARIATSFLLVIQATYMDDGVEDFLVSLNAFATHVLLINAQSIFAAFEDQLRVPTMPIVANTGRSLSSRADMLVAEASNSIAEILDLITSELQLRWWKPLIIGIDNFIVNPGRAYFGFRTHSSNFKDTTLEHMFELFTYESDLFTNESEVAWLQISHWLALHILCHQCEPPDSPFLQSWLQRPILNSWIRQINARISIGLRHHTIWPERMASMPDANPGE